MKNIFIIVKNKNIIYGIRPVIEAINGDKDIDKIMLQMGASGDNGLLIFFKNFFPFLF